MKFSPRDAIRHHQAASLVPRHVRQRWSAAANREYRRTRDIDAAIAAGNFEINWHLDNDDVAAKLANSGKDYPPELLRQLDQQNQLPSEFAAYSRRVEVGDYTSGELHLEYASTLLPTIERQRKESTLQ